MLTQATPRAETWHSLLTKTLTEEDEFSDPGVPCVKILRQVLCLEAPGSRPWGPGWGFPQPGPQTTFCWCRIHQHTFQAAFTAHARTHARTHAHTHTHTRTHARTHAHALIHTHSHTHTDTHRYTYTHTNTAIIADVATLHLYSGKIYTQSPCDLGSSEQPAGRRCAKPRGHCLLRLQGNK